MGKRKEMETEEEVEIDSASVHKKHKKHKKHKHKKKHQVGDEDSGGEINVTDEIEGDAKPAIKLKIKIGGQAVEEGKVDSKSLLDNKVSSSSWEAGVEPIFAAKKPGEDTSDEEREWLEALEKGELDDNGEVKKSKDEGLLTARQRALLHGPLDESLLQLPSGYKTQELTEEQVQRRIQRAKKRREQAHEKREKDKKLTLDRLLKKQETKAKSAKHAKTHRKSQVPSLRYVDSTSGITISLPNGVEFPLDTDVTKPQPKKQQCHLVGCTNLKKYSCSKTGVPLCSLECYKRNLRSKGLGR